MKKLYWREYGIGKREEQKKSQTRPTHETTETLEGSRDANMRIDFDQNTSSCVDVDLKKASFV